MGTDWAVKAYDTCGIRTSYTKAQLATSSVSNVNTGISTTYITGNKASKTLSGINVFVAPHHGMNTMVPFAWYLATPVGSRITSTSTANLNKMNKFDVILYPYWTIRMTKNDVNATVDRDIAYETQDHANEWINKYLSKDSSKIKSYDKGDVTVTINGSTITVAQ